MLEISLRMPRGTVITFPFENDALQACLTNLVADGEACQLVSLQALGVPLVVTGDAPKPAAKTAGPGAPRESGTLRQPVGINTPIQEQAREAMTKAEVDANKAYAAEAGKRAAAAEAKARAEKK